jgi:outer membrane biosynthesis protein TonB
MATNDPIPLFLSDHPEELEQLGIAKDRAVLSSRILKTSILIVTAAAIVFAILWVGNPLILFENATASLFATPAPQDGNGQSMPIVQSTADTQPLPPTASEAPTGGEITTTLKTANQSQTDIPQPLAEVLLNQFQAWGAEEDARPQVPPVQPVQDPQAQLVQTPPEQVRPVQKQQHVRPVQRAKIVKNARAKVVKNTQVRPEQNAQAQDRSVQNAQAPRSRLVQSTGRLN